jgi:8-amino-7-oxononanoate synthase
MPDEEDARAREETAERRQNVSANLTRAMEAELEELASQGQLRSLEVPTGINLCSNDYLGLATHPALRAAVLDGVARSERLGATGSRLLAGHAREWDELEEEFAAFAGTEAALFFTSGYSANVGLLSSVLSRGDIVFSDALNHASLIDGIRLSGAEKVIYAHRELGALEAALDARAGRPGRKLIVTESVFSMDGDLAPLAEMAALAARHGAGLVVDEAHAIGVFGPEGRGRVSELGLAQEMFAVVHTCGKALASAGAFVCGSATLKKYLINRARTFLFNTALPPYFAAQVRKAVELARGADAERARLASSSVRLRAALQAGGWNTGGSASQIVPVMLGENSSATRVAGELERGGFAVRAIRPPTVPEGSARLRLSLTCKVTDADLSRLAKVLGNARGRGAAQSAGKL